jgi:hypothetical protein
VLIRAMKVDSTDPNALHGFQCKLRAITIAAQMSKHDLAQPPPCDRCDQFCGGII